MGYTFLLSEKLEAAKRIATALDDENKPEICEEKGVPYFVASRKGRKLVIVSAIGHLYTTAPEMRGRFYYPIFNVKWIPAFLANSEANRTKNWIEVISKLSKEASDFLCATDCDIEGEVIGYTILKYTCGEKDSTAKRMIFSTLTNQELINAYENPSKNLNFNLVESGETRHIIDFLWGINLSRALTLAAKNWRKRYATLSAGRVQAPTLKFLVEHEKKICSFVPIPYWIISAKAEINDQLYEIQYKKKIVGKRDEAKEIVNKCKGKEGIVRAVRIRTYKQLSPPPFNIGELQAEAYKLFGYTPSQTLRIAETLYLNALISYPRTNSQQIPSQINYKSILSSLGREDEYRRLTSCLLAEEDLVPNEGTKEDSAHPSVYPTGNLPEKPLNASQKRIFNLIVKRFMAVFGKPAVKQLIKIAIEVNGQVFYLYGREVLNEGWMVFYKPYIKANEVHLPPIKKGQIVQIQKVAYEAKFTSPPPRYNPSSLLKLMEETQIGTKATRSNIIDALYTRYYVRNKSIEVTELGLNVAQILENHCPQILSVDFTRKLEGDLNLIEKGLKNRDEVSEEAVDRLRTILEELKNKEEEIGYELSEVLRITRLEVLIIGSCPRCKTGELIILQSKKTGKRFVGCTNFSKGLCTASFPLPQKPYYVKPAKRDCPACGWPVVRVISRAKRPWNLCLNPSCSDKQKYRRSNNELYRLRSKNY